MLETCMATGKSVQSDITYTGSTSCLSLRTLVLTPHNINRENGPELPEYAPPNEATDTEHEELEQEGEDAEGAATEQEPVDDEEMARRLHIQEQIEHQRRLMELAGCPRKVQAFIPDLLSRGSVQHSQRPCGPGINPDEEEYTEEEEEGYLTDDSVDPDEMTYEARHFCSLHARGRMVSYTVDWQDCSLLAHEGMGPEGARFCRNCEPSARRSGL